MRELNEPGHTVLWSPMHCCARPMAAQRPAWARRTPRRSPSPTRRSAVRSITPRRTSAPSGGVVGKPSSMRDGPISWSALAARSRTTRRSAPRRARRRRPIRSSGCPWFPAGRR